MNKDDDIKGQFQKWLEEVTKTRNLDSSEQCSVNHLSNIGVDVSSVFKEKNAKEIRIQASNLIMQRNKSASNDFKEFAETILFLLEYAEFLEKTENIIPLHQKVLNDKTHDSLIVAYYLSRADRQALQSLGYKSFTEAFRQLGTILDQKPSTIKNMRDEFDPYFDNERVGWYQRELRASRKEVFELLKDETIQEVYLRVKQILSSYSEKANYKNERKIIKIKNYNMKEYKAKK